MQFVVGGSTVADPQVLRDGGIEQVGVLIDQPDRSAKFIAGQPLDRRAAERDGAGLIFQES